MRQVGLDDLEEWYFRRVLEKTGGKIKEAAEHAGIETRSINDKMRNAISSQHSPDQILACANRETFTPLPVYMNYLLQSGNTVPGEVLGALPRKAM